MIFPTDAVLQTRRNLFARLSTGKITEDEAFREALQADPDDLTAIRFLAIGALEGGDLVTAERYARDLIRLHPSAYEGYFVVARVLSEDAATSALANGYARLAFEKMRDNEDALAALDTTEMARHFGFPGIAEGRSKHETLTELVRLLQEVQSAEPDAVARKLEPCRLIAKLCDSWDDLMDPAVVDGILRNADACAPLLFGVLKEWGEEQLTEDDQPVVERALALLGEIGDPAALPAILEFLVRQSDDLSGPADWAFRRITWQHPAASLEKIRQVVPQVGGAERVILAHQIGLMPDVPGRSAVLTRLTEGIERLHRNEQDALLLSAIVGITMVEGRASPLASSLEAQHPRVLSRESRANLRDLRRDVPDGPFVAEPTEITIHQICCEEPDSEDDDEEPPQPFVRQAPKPGRNDPCWCGSGKKYKKCHLDEDQRR